MADLISTIVENYPKLKYELLRAQTFDPSHYGFPKICYTMMETDTQRVNAYQEAFAHYDHFKDKVVCEAGVGTLALTRHILPHVKRAYLIEYNPNLIGYIQEELRKNGWADKTTLIVGDAMKVALPEKVDYIVGELMSIYCANEYQVQIFKHLRQFLKPGGKLIPEKIINLVQLCKAEFEDNHTHYPIMFSRHLPMMLSKQEILNTTDLYKDTQMKVSAKISLEALLSGDANAASMASWVQLAESVNFTGTDSLMPPTVKRLEQAVKLQSGQSYNLEANYEYGTNLDIAKFKITS